MATMVVRAPQCPDTNANRGMAHLFVKAASLRQSMPMLRTVAIYAAIQWVSAWMGHGVSPRIKPWDGNTVMCPDAQKKVSALKINGKEAITLSRKEIQRSRANSLLHYTLHIQK